MPTGSLLENPAFTVSAGCPVALNGLVFASMFIVVNRYSEEEMCMQKHKCVFEANVHDQT